MQGDGSYAGARSWYRFRDTVKDIFGFGQVIPARQGRAAGSILFGVVVNEDSIIPNNTHFDTTRVNIDFNGDQTLDLPCAGADDLVWKRRKEIRGMHIVQVPQFLCHFTTAFDRID